MDVRAQMVIVTSFGGWGVKIVANVYLLAPFPVVPLFLIFSFLIHLADAAKPGRA